MPPPNLDQRTRDPVRYFFEAMMVNDLIDFSTTPPRLRIKNESLPVVPDSAFTSQITVGLTAVRLNADQVIQRAVLVPVSANAGKIFLGHDNAVTILLGCEVPVSGLPVIGDNLNNWWAISDTAGQKLGIAAS